MFTYNGKEWKRPAKKEAGAKLQQLLDDAMLSQAEAADLIGVDHRTMRRYVLGQTSYPYLVWYALNDLRDQREAAKPSTTALRRMKREDLDRELDRWRKEQAKWPNASKAYARAGEHITAIHTEFLRREEKRTTANA